MEQELKKKLRVPQGPAAVLHAPEGYAFGFGDGGAAGKYDFVLLFVETGDELNERLEQAIASLNDDAVFWISYPKQASKIATDLNRDVLAARVGEQTAYRAVSNVAIDDKWSALRFRRRDKVKSKS